MRTLQEGQALALLLSSHGVKQARALALVATEFAISEVDALDLATLQAQPSKLREILNRGFGLEQLFHLYAVSESYSDEKHRISLRMLSDFAEWFLGTDFSEDELVEAVEGARRIYPPYWKKGNLSSELSYALGYARSIRDNSIESIEEKEATRVEQLNLPEEERITDDEGQGD